MDYSLAALKLLCFQLNGARQSPKPKVLTLGAILFQRVWLQCPTAATTVCFLTTALASSRFSSPASSGAASGTLGFM
ncbi:hypothetical protein LINPERHAP2_LOCUS16679 [Linum perenne]